MNISDFNEYISENQEKMIRLQNKAIHLQWKKFIAGNDFVDTKIVLQETLDEWIRCKSLDIDPFGKPQNIVLKGDALEERLQNSEAFIKVSQPFLHRLFRFMKDFSYAVGLFDRDGYLLKVITEEKYMADIRTFNFCPGSRWTYSYAGYCGPASVLEKKRPIQIIGAHHYLNFFHFIAASGAPIFNPDGELLGGLVITTFYSATHSHTLGMVVAAAHAIENEWRAQKALTRCKAAFEETDLASSLQKVILASIPEALIAVNNAGGIMNINEKARNMFGLSGSNTSGMLLQDIFKVEENQSLWLAVNDQNSISDREVRIRTPRGSGDYSLTCNSILLSGGEAIGRLLILSEIKRIKSLVANTIGAKANFTFDDICGHDKRFKKIIDQARMMSKTASNVLLLGESGTGKDILAQAIHNESTQQEGPYVAINCAAIPRDLIASELFGHEEGAFTGARRGGSQGKFELADGGTIFLDEIAEMPLEIQAVLLRVIEDKCVTRVGSSQIRKVNVRIISATNHHLPAEIERGKFRKDLYYRLNVCCIELTPLRERSDDIPLLVDRFIQRYARALGKTICGADDKITELFAGYPWPGNVRELQNVVERMVNYASADRLTVDLIPHEIMDPGELDLPGTHFESPEEKEKQLISRLLTLRHRKKAIAQKLGISRAHLYRKLKKYGLE